MFMITICHLRLYDHIFFLNYVSSLDQHKTMEISGVGQYTAFVNVSFCEECKLIWMETPQNIQLL